MSTAIQRTPLGASTHNRKWFLDVNTGNGETPDWVGVFGVAEFQPAREANMEDDSDFDSAGFQSEGKTAEAWSVVTKLRRKTTADDPTAYDPGQEYLRDHAEGKFGIDNVVDIRYYEMEPNGPRVMAYRGRAAVQWAPDGGDMTAYDVVTVTLTGRGALVPITHPTEDE